jgi:hypothetical protein
MRTSAGAGSARHIHSGDEVRTRRRPSAAVEAARQLVLAAVIVGAWATQAAAQITETERQRLLAHLQITSAWLEDELAGLSAAQLAFRPSPEAWSILEVLEHLVVVGPIYWNDLQRALKTPPRAVQLTGDAEILWYGIDRTHREDAVKAEDAPRQLRDAKAGLAAYRRAHAQLVEYVRTTKDDLRRHLVARQQCDAYQWALLISTHEQRHVLQVREIKRHAEFPRR